MKKKERALFIQKVLEDYYPAPQVPLYHTNNYTLLIAVLLSAQCTDERVNKITPLLFKKAKTAEEMLLLPLLEIEEIIRPCGLYKNKAKAILGLSKILNEKYQGKMPCTFQELEELPGVGHKTASVVMSQCFQIPAFPVDTHIHRCAKRWGLSSGKNVVQTEKDLKGIFPKKSWNKLHLQIIFFAREYCKAKGHDKAKCPICSIFLS
ncbi:MAG TPA: endonuclease III [Parachlamydiaceae bacterium]|nr:endonuclease III [Parachlamydiaceae bacterium]